FRRSVIPRAPRPGRRRASLFHIDTGRPGKGGPDRNSRAGGEGTGRMITSTLKKMRPQRPHLAILVVLLVCSFGLTAVIAHQAVQAARNEQKATITTVLGYVDRIADEFDKSSSAALRAAFTNAFAGIFNRFDDAGTPLDSTQVLAGFDNRYLC